MTDTGVTPQWTDSVLWMILAMVLVLPGCVTKESYTQQVNRTTNLQRLLADEEKHSADLNSEVTRLKNQVGDLEAQNKLISDQLKDARTQVVRSLEEVGRLQEEVQSHRASVRSKRQGVAPAPTEPPDRLGELQFETLGANKRQAKPSRAMTTEKNGASYHEVQRGDTLYNISKRYKTDVKTLKELNGLTSDEIHLGDRLMVSGK
ncbi:MAG TPA: LysM peptidoglycan-binding domain-containing protein [Nitrospirales bacterium]